jgi:hypothetical protein
MYGSRDERRGGVDGGESVMGSLVGGEKGATRKLMVLLFLVRTVVVPQHRREDHAVCRRTCDGGTGDGCRRRVARADSESPRYRAGQRQVFQASEQGMQLAPSCSLPLTRSGTPTFLSQQFYESLARRAAQNGHAIDVFAGCLDQVGLLEMKSLANFTNGYMILADSFNMSIFKQSFQRVFAKDEEGHLQMGFNATFDVQVGCRLAIVVARG